MKTERVLTDDARSRRGCGWVLALGGSLLAVGAAGGMLAAHIVSIGSIIFIVVLLGVVALGLRFVFKPSDYVDVDLDARTFVHVRDHQRRDERPLDSLGTLVVSQRSRTVKTKNGTRTIIEYAVHPEGRADLDFRVVKDRGKARVILETLARRWKLPSCSWGGEVRQPGELDIPLHERLMFRAERRPVVELRPEWHLRIEPLSPGYAIVSSHRDWISLAPAVVMVIPLGFVGYVFAQSGLLANLRSPDRDLVDLIFGGLGLLVLLGVAGYVARLLRDVFLPGAIHVTQEGISYRGGRMAFREIEEIIGALSIEFVGDGRLLKVPSTFCPPEAVSSLCSEIERMILELAPAPGLR
ncbi:MAG: hypothetical protein NDJ92_08510 [Thermoanaerobaculia bacterium]|nr:hypothetical protein [Thermoanaerobaculia bacterium]